MKVNLTRQTLVVSSFLSLFLGFASPQETWASGQWDAARIQAFHARLALSAERSQAVQADSPAHILLPVSPGYDQGGTSLCWVYATLNVIESDYLSSHASGAIALSRSAMQLLNMEDRYTRKIKGIENNVYEGGTPVNAIGIIRNADGWLRQSGLFALGDYSAAPADTSATDPLGFAGTGSVSDQIAQMDQGLDTTFGALPAETHDASGVVVTAAQDAQEILGTDAWTAYGQATATQAPGVGPHFDPDARSGTQATYLAAAQFKAIFLQALQSGHALTVDWGGHEEEIYGADFDSSGNPTQLYLKGSYGPTYEYTMAASDALSSMVGVSTTTVAMAAMPPL